MRTIIAGSRGILDFGLVERCIEQAQTVGHIQITEVVSGTARGVDRMGEAWARKNNIPVTQFPADWDRYGKRAGYLRNVEMAKYAEAAIILWDGSSPGTRHMIELAEKAGLHKYVLTLKPGSTPVSAKNN